MGAFLSLKMQILPVFSNQTLVIKGNNSCQKQCFMEIALQEREDLYTKAGLRFLLQFDI